MPKELQQILHICSNYQIRVAANENVYYHGNNDVIYD